MAKQNGMDSMAKELMPKAMKNRHKKKVTSNLEAALKGSKNHKDK